MDENICGGQVLRLYKLMLVVSIGYSNDPYGSLFGLHLLSGLISFILPPNLIDYLKLVDKQFL